MREVPACDTVGTYCEQHLESTETSTNSDLSEDDSKDSQDLKRDQDEENAAVSRIRGIYLSEDSEVKEEG